MRHITIKKEDLSTEIFDFVLKFIKQCTNLNSVDSNGVISIKALKQIIECIKTENPLHQL